MGRCIAEQQYASKTYAVTLTYGGGDTLNATMLIYPDFQNFMKRLRAVGYTVRYIVAGEYGTLKERAHWHAILFFYGKYPEVKTDREKYIYKHWKEGFSYWQEPSWKSFAYALKYALKEVGGQNHLAMSKKPPLGDTYMDKLVDHYIDHCIAPDEPFYSFRDVFDNKGKRRQFKLQGRSLEIFIERFLDRYQKQHAKDYLGFGKVIEKYDRREVARKIKEQSPNYLFELMQKRAEKRRNKNVYST